MARVDNVLNKTLIYGIGDAIVLLVGGFLLIPLYTRVLSQGDFATYIIVKTNLEIISFVMFFGLPSAVSRVYFEAKKRGRRTEYMSSIVNLYAILAVLFGLALFVWGSSFWSLLSPKTVSYPYLSYCYAIALLGFFGVMASTWLRMDERLSGFVTMQVGSAVVLALGVMINLNLMEDKLIAIISALLLSNIFASLWLPVLFAKGYRCKIQLAEVLETLKYALPFMFGYLSYFVLNKISIVLLQRHAPLEEIASYGLAQQLAMMIPIIGAALGKAIQPSIFSATDDRKALLLISQYSGIILQVLASVAVLLIIFAPEFVQIVASSTYKSTATMFRLLLLGSFLFSLTLVSDTILLYFKKPVYSTLATVIGAVCATSLGYILIPLYNGYGATMAIVSAYSVSTLVSFMLAYGFNRHLKTAPLALASLAMVGAVVFVESLDYLDVHLSLKLVIKIAIAGLVFKFAWKNLTNLKEKLGI